MHDERWIQEELSAIRRAGLRRSLMPYSWTGGRITIGRRTFLNFSSNDYLDLARNPAVVASAIDALRKFGAGATASRLVSGTLDIHCELEERLAKYKGYPAALVFGSGYMTNAGLIASVADRSDHIFTDRLAHASILDAAILSRATLHRFRHNDVQHLDELLGRTPGRSRRLIVTESVFSMDGDLAPLRDIAAVARKHRAMLMVDEAHATGVFGPAGSGLVRTTNLEKAVNFSMGTLSKALGGYGGFVACSAQARELLVNTARSFIYSTALPPAAGGAAIGALKVIAKRPGMGAELLKRAARFARSLRDGGMNTGPSESQIIPVIVGTNAKAMSLSASLRKKGIIAPAIRPPTVPEGSARLRFSVTLAHTADDLEEAAAVILRTANS